MYTYKKSERLGSVRLKKLLFAKGEHLFVYPFKVLFFVDGPGYPGLSWPGKRPLPPAAVFSYPAKCLVAVPGRLFKKAVERNRIRRLVKEAYRKNKSPFYTFLQGRGSHCLLAFIYVSKKTLPYSAIEEAVTAALKEVQNRISNRGAEHSGAGGQGSGDQPYENDTQNHK